MQIIVWSDKGGCLLFSSELVRSFSLRFSEGLETVGFLKGTHTCDLNSTPRAAGVVWVRLDFKFQPRLTTFIVHPPDGHSRNKQRWLFNLSPTQGRPKDTQFCTFKCKHTCNLTHTINHAQLLHGLKRKVKITQKTGGKCKTNVNIPQFKLYLIINTFVGSL